MKYHFCFRFFATWASQQHFKTSPYDMGWCFGGSVGIEQFIWQIVRRNQYSQFPLVHDFRKPWWGVAYVPCVTNPRGLYAWVILWHVTGMLSLAEHWHGRRALSNHVCAHLAIACSEQSRSMSVLSINHVIQMPQCLSGFVNHDYIFTMTWVLISSLY